ncbi:uncharacterized protein CDAR_9171 [Caerostris darwini]|uniref:Uncharacterized protein n=1 Tax=Caerostris darwini TaxID=1538125 RepID=A0AAV4UY72_9ARAC|nr:uncharacterized protein CDAR_9171 [Caerostris darwini]
MVGKSKAKSHQASPPPEKARTPVQTNNATSLKRAVSESDLTEKRCDHKNLPLRPFENPKHVDNQGHRRKESKKQNHVPLEELLKNLKTKERRRQGHRRGVSDGGNIRYDYDKQS